MIKNCILTPPSTLRWQDPPILPKYQNHSWRGHVGTRSLIPPNDGAIYYVDPVLGNDAGLGTPTSPLRTMYKALGTGNVGMVYLAPSPNPTLNDGGWGLPVIVTFASHIIVRPWNIRSGRPMVTNAWAHQETNWIADPLPRVYDNAPPTPPGRPGVTHFVDMGGGLLGNPLHFAKGSIKGDLSNRPGTWFQNQGGSALSVNTMNGPVPSPSLKCFIGNYCAAWNSNKNLYIEGIDFVGGLHTFWVIDQSCDAFFIDCGFYCSAGNGLFTNTSGLVITENCRSDFHMLDAFNRHMSPTYGPGKMIEINCYGSISGVGVGASNQISTIHDGMSGLRIGGDYGGAGNHVMCDVNVGTEAWNVGVRCRASRDPLGYGYYTVDAESWNYDVDFGTSFYPLGVAGGVAHLDLSDPSTHITSGSGVVDTYCQT